MVCPGKLTTRVRVSTETNREITSKEPLWFHQQVSFTNPRSGTRGPSILCSESLFCNLLPRVLNASLLCMAAESPHSISFSPVSFIELDLRPVEISPHKLRWVSVLYSVNGSLCPIGLVGNVPQSLLGAQGPRLKQCQGFGSMLPIGPSPGHMVPQVHVPAVSSLYLELEAGGRLLHKDDSSCRAPTPCVLIKRNRRLCPTLRDQLV